MIVFSRITSTGTQGAAEFFSSPKSVAELRGKLDGKMPTAYQVVVRCTYSNKLLPDYHYHSHKIL